MADKPYVKLDLNRRRSVATASRLIHDAGFRDKARLIDDLLERGRIFIDPNLPATSAGKSGDSAIHLSDNAKMQTAASPPAPLERKDPDLVRLAALLVNLADQALGDSLIDAYGDEITFCGKIGSDAELFPGATNPERRSIADAAKAIEKEALRKKEAAAKSGSPSPPAKLKMELKVLLPGAQLELIPSVEIVALRTDFPDVPASTVELRMDAIAAALYRYRDCTGAFPRGDNARMTRALRKQFPSELAARDVDSAGRIVDAWGRPYVYRCPGNVFADAFDLYSLGPCGKDDGGAGDNILCELRRRTS